MRVKMQQPAYKCEKMQMRALFVNGPIPDMNHRKCDQYMSVNGAPDRVFVSHQSHLFPDGESNLT